MTTKVAVVLAGDGLTKITVVQDDKVIRGQGFEFLDTFKTTFARSQVKLVVKVKKLWCVGGKCGLSLEATQAVFKACDKAAEVDVFSNDSELLA